MVWYINYHKTDKRENAGLWTEEGRIRPKCLGHRYLPQHSALVLPFSMSFLTIPEPGLRVMERGPRQQPHCQGAGDDQEKLIREGLVAELLVMGTSVTCVLPRHLDGD